MPDYPTEEVLTIIRGWPAAELDVLMAQVEASWSPFGQFERKGRLYQLATGGWSGNEKLIAALESNTSFFWTMCWQLSQRGGYFEFELPEFLLAGYRPAEPPKG